MKRTQDDIQLGRLLKQHSASVGENPWFTPRVLNRLPERPRSSRWRGGVLCTIAIVLCAACWQWLIHSQDFTVLTVRDITHYAAMVAITLAIVWQAIATAIRSD